MKRLLLSVAAIAAIIPAGAQSKINPQGQAIIQQYKELHAQGAVRTAAVDVPERMNVLVNIAPGSSLDDFSDIPGIEVMASTGHFAVINMPVSEIEQFSELNSVKSLSFGIKARPMLNKAREAAFVNEVQAGTGLNSAYTGKGVYAALFDTGLEPNHINFRDADGKSRVRGVWTVFGWEEGKEQVKEYLTEKEIASFTTEKSAATHGTHVLGIMAGSYNGPGYLGGDSKPHDGDIPFWGVSPDAEILIGCGDLYQNDILIGVDRIINKAEADGKPVAINLSLGINSGPHDGSSDFCQALDEYGKRAIFSISAGNEGDENIGVSYDFSSKNKTFKTFLGPSAQSQSFKGTCEFWMSDGDIPDAKLVIYSRLKGETIYQVPIGNLHGGYLTLAGANWKDDKADRTEFFDDAWDANSNVKVYSGVDSNKRYWIYLDENLNYLSMDNSIYKDYAIGITISAPAGKQVFGYAEPGDNYDYTAEFTNFGLRTWQAGSPNGSINDMATGKNVMAIGAYVTREYWTNLDGYSYHFTNGDYTPGHIAPFSSYGTIFGNRNLPDICAPGSTLISSVNSYYVQKLNDIDRECAAVVESNSKSYYWMQMQGTSMAAPFAGGVFTSWLQADPTLTIDRIREVAVATAVKGPGYETSGNPVQWGAGQIDALAGIKMILAGSGIGTVEADPDADSDDRALVITSPSRGILDILFAGATHVDAQLFNLSGVPVASARADGMELSLDASSLAPGIYIIRVATPAATISRKIRL